LFFSTPVYILLDSTLVHTLPNALIIYSPQYPHYYSNTTLGFVNDWFHFTHPHLENNFQRLGIPLNRIFYLDQSDFVRDFIRELELEYKLKELHYEDNIHAQLTSFFIQITRSLHHQNTSSTNIYLNSLKEEFRSLRSKILTHYQHAWTTDEMAASVKLSRSRFCVLYKTFFSISPKEDLLTERFKMARHLLLTTHLNIEEVSAKVGYANFYHFSKQFKHVVGCSPSQYRHQNQ